MRNKLVMLMVIGCLFIGLTSCKKIELLSNIDEFINLIKNRNCADINNQIFQINGDLVLTHRRGNCPDNSFHTVLYQDSPDTLLAEHYGSIGGPVLDIYDESYRYIFEIIIKNLDEDDLGLGSNYTVQEVLF